MERPEGMFSTIIWVLSLPVYVPLYFTLSRPQFRVLLTLAQGDG